jgi:bifunctional non-homologous end joining protein LigD
MPAMEFISPQLALLVDAVPAGDEWLHEQKFDGYRIEAVRSRAGVRLYTRRGNDWTDTFPTIAEAVAEVSAKPFVLDGEVAVLRADGVTDFQGLQQALKTRSPNLVYFVFDLLEEGDKDLRGEPLLARKARLEKLLEKLLAKASPVLRFSEHVVGHGEQLFAEACKRGLEGIICKRANAPYTSGRGKSWVKVKCRRRQELVVGGFTEPEGSRTGLGALLVGYYDGKDLRYAGKVGTGFNMKSLGDLFGELAPLERATSAFTPAPPRAQTGPRAHWVEPRLVVEVQFGEWTQDGRLRHPSFQGVRRDKRPKDVVRELAAQ